MENIEFRQVPEEKAVYKVQEGCCLTKVVYDGPGLGIYSRLDRDNEEVGILLCYCHPKKEITPISEEIYQHYYQMVAQQLRRA